jgi:hypothetical protein
MVVEVVDPVAPPVVEVPAGVVEVVEPEVARVQAAVARTTMQTAVILRSVTRASRDLGPARVPAGSG